MAVSFDLYDTLVSADRPAEPWSAVAAALEARGVRLPEDWEAAYRSSHHETEPLAERSLVTHVEAALRSRGLEPSRTLLEEALLDAFDGPVRVRPGARAALATAADSGPVGILSNCSLPGLVESTLDRVALPIEFDAVVTSVDCGWRKPHDRAFETMAAALDTAVTDLVHVGDDPRADGGGRTAGATVILLTETPLPEVADRLEASP